MAGIQNTIVFSQGEKLQTSSADDIAEMQRDASDVARINYVGDPNGNVAANPSSLCHDPVSGEVYIKKTGTGNTGWEEIGGEVTSPPVASLAYFSNKNGDAYVTSAGWLKCDGSVVSQATYPLLYARIGLINGPGINWTSRTSGTSSTINSSTWGNNLYLIGGAGGILRSSTDGITWTTKTSGFSSTIQALGYGGGQYLYGGQNGGYGFSADGTTFTTRTPSIGVQGAPNQGNFGPYIGYNSGLFFGLCQGNGGVLTSTDAVTWTTRNNGSATTLSGGGIIFGGGQYVYVGGAGYVATSTDAITWTPKTSGTSTNFSSVFFGNSIYVLSKSGDGMYLTSTDLVTFTNRNPGFGAANPINGACFGLGVFLLYSGSSVAKTTTNFVTYNNISPTSVYNVALFNGTLFVAGGNTGLIKTSTDGLTWNTRTSNTTSSISALIWTGALHVYATNSGGLGTSTDGITWTARTSGTTSTINALAYDGTLYHAAGCNFGLTSTDAITWTANATYTGTTSTINSIIFAGGIYVFAGQGGVLKTSTDGITWTNRTSGTSSNINALTFGTVYAYAGDGGVLATSTDAITWNAQTSGTTSSIFSLGYNGSLYLYGGAAGTLASSTDGVTWTPRTSNTTNSINGLASFNGFSAYAAPGANMGSSTDGITWYSRVKANSNAGYNTLTYGGPQFVAGGNSGTMETSPTDYLYDETTQFQLPTDAQILITNEATTNFFRSLYIKALL